MQVYPLFVPPAPVEAPPIPYPAFESAMGSTYVWEQADDQADDVDATWRQALALQLVLDRIQGLA